MSDTAIHDKVMHDTITLIGIPETLWNTYPKLRPFAELASDATIMQRRIAKRMNTQVESERLQDQCELIQRHAMELLLSSEGSMCRHEVIDRIPARYYLSFLTEVSEMPDSLEPVRRQQHNRPVEREFYKDVTLPPATPTALARLLIWLGMKKPPQSTTERRRYTETVMEYDIVDIITSTSHFFPWHMCYFRWEDEVEHYYDLALRAKVEPFLIKHNYGCEEEEELCTALDTVIIFFRHAQQHKYSVVLCLTV